MTRNEIIRDQNCGGMYMVIPSVVMLDQALSMSAKMLYGVVTWKCGERAFCWLTNRALGEILGLSPKRVSCLLSQLEEQGHIESEIIKNEAGQVVRRNLYPVVKSAKGILDTAPENEDTPIPENGDTPPQDQGEPIHKNEEEKHKRETKKENPPKAPQGGRKPSRYDLTEEAKTILRAYVGEDREMHRALGAFMELRRELRAVNSGKAVRLLLGRLEEYSGGSRENKLSLINQSIVNSWKGIFPLRWAADQGKPTAPAVRPSEEIDTW